MIVTNLAIDRSTTVYVLLVLIIIAGLYCYGALPRESNPEVIIPIVVATTTYQGVAPRDMETLITVPIERELAGLSGLKEIRSTSAEGLSSIEIEFDTDTAVDAALQRVRDKVDQVRGDLPEEADETILREVNFSEFPIMYVSLTGNTGLALLTQFAEELEEELEAIPGILDVEVVGGVEREIQIQLEPERAAVLGVSITDLEQLARVENTNTPAGSLRLGEAQYSVRVPGEFTSMEDIGDLVVKAGEQGIVYLRDIATVKDGFKDITSISRLDGREAVTLTVSKRAGANVIAVAQNVRRAISDFESRMLTGMEAHVTMDESVEIRDMVAELENSILSGLILVLIVIFLFLGIFNAVFVSLAIPVSMLLTFIALYTTDTSLNMVTLFALMLSLGMLVDNGIVVVENMYRHYQEGKAPAVAAKDGAAEVAWPIVASTVTTMAAFSPMFFWPGIWGEFMRFLPMTVSFSLAASLFVGLIVNPALSSRLLRFQRVKERPPAQKNVLILRIYERILRLALQWRAVTITAACMALAIIIMMFFATSTVEFVPNVEPTRAYVDVDAAEGTALDVTDGLVSAIEVRSEVFRADLEFLIANVGTRGSQQGGGSFGASGTSSHIGRVTLDFPLLDQVEMRPNEILSRLRQMFTEVAGANITINEQQMGPDSGPPINIEVSGRDSDVLAQVARDLEARLQTLPDVVDIQNDYEEGKPEIRVLVDREQALLLGMDSQYIGKVIQAAIDGRKAGEYRDGDKEYDVAIHFPESFRRDMRNLEALEFINHQGTAVPFSSIARLEAGSGPGSISRLNRKRTVTVSANAVNRPGPEVLKDVQTDLASFPLPAGYVLNFTGENEESQETEDFLLRAFVVALFLIALVLITQFNSIVQPLIIMTSVVLSLSGVFLGLYLRSMPFGVLMTGIGCISLAGVVVNNAIVLLDFINQLRARGLSTEEAIVRAGVTRFRPVMLTAVTTILGLIPMAVGISFDFRKWTWITASSTAEWWGPMAIAIIFGLGFATILTLVVVPALYSLSASVTGDRVSDASLADRG